MTATISPAQELWGQKLRRDFKQLCPSSYQATNPQHAGMPPPSVLSKVLDWKYSKNGNGLLLHGKTGRGKTRCAWLLIARLMQKDGVKVRAVNDPSFSREYSRRLGNGTASEWMDDLCRSMVLFLDDFGKAAVTPRYKELFYDLLEARSSHGRPVILTTQLSTEDLIERFGDQDGRAIVRRILDFCDIIHL